MHSSMKIRLCSSNQVLITRKQAQMAILLLKVADPCRWWCSFIAATRKCQICQYILLRLKSGHIYWQLGRKNMNFPSDCGRVSKASIWCSCRLCADIHAGSSCGRWVRCWILRTQPPPPAASGSGWLHAAAVPAAAGHTYRLLTLPGWRDLWRSEEKKKTRGEPVRKSQHLWLTLRRKKKHV